MTAVLAFTPLLAGVILLLAGIAARPSAGHTRDVRLVLLADTHVPVRARDLPAEVWDAVARITYNQVVHVYYNGKLEHYLEWAEQAM